MRGPAYFIKPDGGADWTIVTSLRWAHEWHYGCLLKDPLNGFVVGMDTNKFSADCRLPITGDLLKPAMWRNMDTSANDNHFLRVSLENVLAYAADRICFASAEQVLF